ncbi:MAG: hypothetical protein ACK56F_01300, partial [bacterium]
MRSSPASSRRSIRRGARLRSTRSKGCGTSDGGRGRDPWLEPALPEGRAAHRRAPRRRSRPRARRVARPSRPVGLREVHL